MTNFNDLKISDLLKKSIADMKYTKITEVQDRTIPLVILNKNVICKSHTGSGKTLAFGIPLSDRILTKKSSAALILGPTRELVVQVRDELIKLNKHTGLKAYCVYGGHRIADEISTLKRKPHLLAATPGRLLDHFKRHSINPQFFDTVVLDEADRMLDMGFIEDIKKILSAVKPDRVHLFSATLDGKVATLIKEYIPEYEEIVVKDEIIGKNILEQHLNVKKEDKFSELLKIVNNADRKRVLVFTSTKRYVDILTEKLTMEGIRAIGIHGDKSQRFRELALDDFRKGRMQVLIATDVAARGLQIDNVEYVVNYDKANDDDTHKHRIGRTGRMGKTGHAITFVSDDDSSKKSRSHSRSSGSFRQRSSSDRSNRSSRFDERPRNRYSTDMSDNRSNRSERYDDKRGSRSESSFSRDRSENDRFRRARSSDDRSSRSKGFRDNSNIDKSKSFSRDKSRDNRTDRNRNSDSRSEKSSKSFSRDKPKGNKSFGPHRERKGSGRTRR